jgi:tripartite-type tricarboxylate transporter receptor subunit TctC
MRFLFALTLPFLAVAIAQPAMSQELWPNKPVKLVVPFAPGGATDGLGRMLGQQMAEVWKQPVIIDNKAGAGTVLGTNAVAKSPPDGYTLGMVVSSHAINPTLRPNLPYDTLKDLTPVTQVGVQHFVLAANPSFPANNLKELIELARKEPGRLSYASPGSGTALHLAMELLKIKTGINIVHVPYRGGAPAQQDVLGGQVPLIIDIYHSTAPLIKAGKLKAIALFSARRPASVPDIPVVAETVPGLSALSTVGIVVPAGTPSAIVEKASADIARILKNKEFSDKLLAMGVEAVGSTPKEYEELIRSDIAMWAPVIKASGATPD